MKQFVLKRKSKNYSLDSPHIVYQTSAPRGRPSPFFSLFSLFSVFSPFYKVLYINQFLIETLQKAEKTEKTEKREKLVNPKISISKTTN
jgi:hypothetical protein